MCRETEAIRGTAADPATAFADLGLTSTDAMPLWHRLSPRTGLRLPATLVWAHPNPAAVAAFLNTLTTGEKPMPVPPPPGPQAEPIAIVAVGCRYPGGVNSPEDLWRLVPDGVDATAASHTPHPALLDAALHAARLTEGPGKARVPLDAHAGVLRRDDGRALALMAAGAGLPDDIVAEFDDSLLIAGGDYARVLENWEPGAHCRADPAGAGPADRADAPQRPARRLAPALTAPPRGRRRPRRPLHPCPPRRRHRGRGTARLAAGMSDGDQAATAPLPAMVRTD